MARVRFNAQDVPDHGFGFEVWGPGSRVEGLRSANQGLVQVGFDAQDAPARPVDSGFTILGCLRVGT